MDNVLLYAVAALIVAIVLIIVTFIKRSSSSGDAAAADHAARPVQVDRQAAPVRGGVRRRGAQQRLAAAARRQDDSEEEYEDDDPAAEFGQTEGKIGAKKLRKLQEKAEKRAQREAELQERVEKKERDARLEERRKKEEAKREAEEKAQEEEARLRREEEEKREHEEYLKLKAAFSVEEEGVEEVVSEQDAESLLQKFIDYIKEMKVVMLEDLASHFKIKTQDAIDRITQLQDDGRLSGLMDDRGKFIFITHEEYQAVARFIKQRGRVSISELAQSSNSLINMNPDNSDTLRRLTEAC